MDSDLDSSVDTNNTNSELLPDVLHTLECLQAAIVSQSSTYEQMSETCEVAMEQVHDMIATICSLERQVRRREYVIQRLRASRSATAGRVQSAPPAAGRRLLLIQEDRL